MVKSAVRVVVRTRPTNEFAHDMLIIDPTAATVNVHVKKDVAAGYVNHQQEDWSFKFDSVLHNVPQETVYEQCATPVVNSVLEGYNGTILAYGQTGAGKTYTMMGGADNYKFRGVTPRAISHLFREIAERQEQSITVRISYLEIYNEVMYDLLAADAGGNSDRMTIMEDPSGYTYVRGLSQRLAATEEEALNLLFEGEMNRAIAEHQLNAASSRSHCVFTIHLEMRSRVESSEKIVRSKLNLVDLAGSERVGKTGSEGVVLKEATYINKSLSFLEQVVIALSDRRREHVPFRQSKLTSVLRDSLGGNCKTTMIANIWLEAQHIDETISTLRFATRMMRVSNEAVQNVEYDPAVLCKKYEREIAELKKELAMRDALAGRGQISYDPYTEEQRFDLRATLRRYLNGEIEAEDVEIPTLHHAREMMGQFRELFKTLSAEGGRAGARALAPEAGRTSAAAGATGGAAAPDAAAGKGADAGVGELDAGSGGFAVGGRAPPGARPKQGVAATAALSATPPRAASPSRALGATGSDAGGPGVAGSSTAMPDRKEAFEAFKTAAGAAQNKILVESKAQLVEKKRVLKDLATRVNAAKSSIDAVKEKLDRKALERQGRAADEADVVDEEEFALMKEMKDYKKQYREAFDALKAARAEAEYTERLVEQARVKLVSDFDEWYASTYAPPPPPLAAGSRGLPQDDETRYMDDQERFDRMEAERIAAEDPDSLAFYNARKAVRERAKLAGTRTTGIVRRGR